MRCWLAILVGNYLEEIYHPFYRRERRLHLTMLWEGFLLKLISDISFCRMGATLEAHSFRILAGIPSGPVALLTCNFFNSFFNSTCCYLNIRHVWYIATLESWHGGEIFLGKNGAKLIV